MNATNNETRTTEGGTMIAAYVMTGDSIRNPFKDDGIEWTVERVKVGEKRVEIYVENCAKRSIFGYGPRRLFCVNKNIEIAAA
jgi:hypothetical protein